MRAPGMLGCVECALKGMLMSRRHSAQLPRSNRGVPRRRTRRCSARRSPPATRSSARPASASSSASEGRPRCSTLTDRRTHHEPRREGQQLPPAHQAGQLLLVLGRSTTLTAAQADSRCCSTLRRATVRALAATAYPAAVAGGPRHQGSGAGAPAVTRQLCPSCSTPSLARRGESMAAEGQTQRTGGQLRLGATRGPGRCGCWRGEGLTCIKPPQKERLVGTAATLTTQDPQVLLVHASIQRLPSVPQCEFARFQVASLRRARQADKGSSHRRLHKCSTTPDGHGLPTTSQRRLPLEGSRPAGQPPVGPAPPPCCRRPAGAHPPRAHRPAPLHASAPARTRAGPGG